MVVANPDPLPARMATRVAWILVGVALGACQAPARVPEPERLVTRPPERIEAAGLEREIDEYLILGAASGGEAKPATEARMTDHAMGFGTGTSGDRIFGFRLEPVYGIDLPDKGDTLIPRADTPILGLADASSESERPPAEASDHGKEHEFHPNHVAVLAGGVVQLNKDEVSPVVGLSYERRFSARWGAEALVDYIFGKHERDWLVLVGVTYRPTHRLKLFAGPGLEFVEKEGSSSHDLKLALGVGASYEFELPNGFSIAPVLAVDFIGETGTNIGLQISLGKGF